MGGRPTFVAGQSIRALTRDHEPDDLPNSLWVGGCRRDVAGKRRTVAF